MEHMSLEIENDIPLKLKKYFRFQEKHYERH